MVGAYNCDGYARRIRKDEFDILELSSPSPILCQANPRSDKVDVSRWILSSRGRIICEKNECSPSSTAVPSRQPRFIARVRMAGAHLSPRPWAMMTVAVCFLTAGTSNAGPAILCMKTILFALIERLTDHSDGSGFRWSTVIVPKWTSWWTNLAG